MQETDRSLRNQSMMIEMHPAFCTKVLAVLQEMEQAGFRPRIQEAWRSPEDQLAAYGRGASKLKYGFHNVTSADGTMEALAADILDDDAPDKPGQSYILHLAAAALRNGLMTGAFFSLNPDQVSTLYKALVEMKWDAQVSTGWDPLHVQVTGITLEEARAGKRPGEPFTPPAAAPDDGIRQAELVPPPAAATTETPAPGTAPDDGKQQEEPVATPVAASTPTAVPGTAPQAAAPKRHYRLTNLDTNRSVDHERDTPFQPVTLLAVPYVPQSGSWKGDRRNDSASACAVMLLRAHLGLNMTPAEFHARCGIREDALANVGQVRNVLGGLGLLTDLRTRLSVQDLLTVLVTGTPLITLVHYKPLSTAGLTMWPYEGLHFGVAVGMDCRNIYLHDPLYTDPAAGEAHAYPLNIFQQAWKDCPKSPGLPNPECSAIIPTAGIGFRLTRRVRVTAWALYVRSLPSTTGKVVATLHQDELVEIQREMNGWGEIGNNRWISLRHTTVVPG